MPHLSRRTFVLSSLAAGGLVSMIHRMQAAEPQAEIPYRTLGRTGEKVSLVGLGGFHIGMQKTEEESIRIIRTAVDQGINFLDNCWDYNGGASEMRMGKALRDGYRARAFLMSKIDGRDKKTAAQQIDESLQRLQTDRIDLMQFHEIIRVEDPARIFAEGGALEAMLEAKKAGKVRYIGFTGHKSPDIHLKMLATAREHQFRFDTVQMPLNVMDAHFASFEKKVLPELVTAGIGVLGDEIARRPRNSQEQRGHCDRVPALRDESSHQRGHHGLRHAGHPRPGAPSRSYLQAFHRGRKGSLAGQVRATGWRGEIRAVQNQRPVRWHGSEPSLAGLRSAVAVMSPLQGKFPSSTPLILASSPPFARPCPASAAKRGHD